MVVSQDLDGENLTAYLEGQIPSFRGPITVEKFPRGQSNPTYAIHTPDAKYVLRRKPLGKLLKSAHAVDREYRVLKALAGTDVPVPQVFHLCTDNEVIGSWFYVMEYISGRVLWDPALPNFLPHDRTSVYEELNRVLAAIHQVDIEAVGLTNFGQPGNYYERQVNRWTKQYRASEVRNIREMETLIEWLPKNVPPDDGWISLIHGDFRLDNIIFSSNGCRAIAVLDWELSTIGHPIADLAYQCMQRHMGQDLYFAGLANLDTEKLGIPSESKFIETYCQRMGIDHIEYWSFYLACSFFRLAAICQGVEKRALDGNASSEHALKLGAMVEPLARLGNEALEQVA